jgi:hypothetical protein
MVIAGYVSVCVQLYCAGFHCLSLHVSADMAIFMCVGFFIYLSSYVSSAQEQNTNGKHAECDHTNKRAANQKSSEAESFKRMKINI